MRVLLLFFASCVALSFLENTPTFSQTQNALSQTPDAGDATEKNLPQSIRSLPKDVAFFYAIHDGAKLIELLKESKLSEQAAKSEIAQDLAAELAPDLQTDSLDLGIFEIETGQITDGAKKALEGREVEVYPLLSQLCGNDAIICGDVSWSETWESLSKVILVAQQTLSLETQGEGENTLEGVDEVIDLPEFANIRVPNTLAAFTLEDTKPAESLIDQIHSWAINVPKEELGDWHFGKHSIGENSLQVFSYPLDNWDVMTASAKLTAEDIVTRQKMKKVLSGRSIHLAMGLIDNRLVLFLGEELDAIDRLAGIGLDEKDRLAATDHLDGILPAADEMMIATAYRSDRYANSNSAIGNSGVFSSIVEAIAGIARMAEVDGVPINQIAPGLGMLGGGFDFKSKSKEIAEKWNSLNLKPAGWVGSISISKSGITGRTVLQTVDPRLPQTGLNVDQHIDPNAMFLHARQSTTIGQRTLLVVDFFGALVNWYMDLLTGLGVSDEMPEDGKRSLQRIGQLPMRLAAITNDHWLPALGDGGIGFAIVANLDVDPTGDFDESSTKSPYDFALVAKVKDADKLRKAGDMMRTWLNSMFKQYTLAATSMDDELPETVFQIPPPHAADDGGSDIYEFNWDHLEGVTKEDLIDETEPGLFNYDYHWRLNQETLVFGGNRDVTRSMLKHHPQPPSVFQLPGVRRSITRVDLGLYAKQMVNAADRAIAKADDIDPDEMKEFEEFLATLRALPTFHTETRTNNGKTYGAWKLSLDTAP